MDLNTEEWYICCNFVRKHGYIFMQVRKTADSGFCYLNHGSLECVNGKNFKKSNPFQKVEFFLPLHMPELITDTY